MTKHKSLLAAAFLTTTLLCAVPAASACGNGLDERCTYPDASTGPIQAGGPVDCATLDPGEPGGGVLGLSQWYAKATAHDTCVLAKAAQDTTLQGAGDAAWVAGSAGTGALGLVNASSIASSLPAYQGDLTAAVLSQAHDTCFVLLGPFCGNDTAVDQVQRCPAGVAVPNPVPGSLTGNTLDNGNGVVQATCSMAGAVSESAPGGTEVADHANGTQATLLEQVLGLPGPAGTVSEAVFQYANETLFNLCIYLTEENPCGLGEAENFALGTVGWNLGQAGAFASNMTAFIPVLLNQEAESLNTTRNLVCDTDAAVGTNPPNLNNCGGIGGQTIESANAVYAGLKAILEAIDPALAEMLPPSLIPS